MTPETDPLPDFRWPHRAMEYLLECISALWERLLYKLDGGGRIARSFYAAMKIGALLP